MGLKPAEEIGGGSLAAASFPVLVYDHGEQPDNSQTVVSVADGSSRTRRVPELRSYRCLETPSGLVLTVHGTSLQTSLWNPETGEKIELPAMNKELPDCCACLLSGAVSSPEWLVLVYALCQSELLLYRVRGGAASAWASLSYDIGVYPLPEWYAPPTKMQFGCMAALGGKFYSVNGPRSDSLTTLSFSYNDDDPDEEPRLEMVTFDAPTPEIESDALQVCTLCCLLESAQEEELYLVCVFYLGCSFERVEEVGAYRMDFARHEWCRVTDIGDRAFLVGPAPFAASCPAAEHGLKSGCVYFADDLLGDSNDYHVFDLKEGTREVAGPAQGVPVLSRKPFWLVPVRS